MKCDQTEINSEVDLWSVYRQNIQLDCHMKTKHNVEKQLKFNHHMVERVNTVED